MKLKIKKYFLPILFVVALIFRISLTNIAMHGDLIVQSGWGNWIYQNKSMYGFYENNIWIYGWPNQPPLISFLYGFGFKIHEMLNTIFVYIGNFIAVKHLGAAHIPWFYQFTVWFFGQKYSDTPFAVGQLISMKLIPIVGDLFLAYFLYKFCRKVSSKKIALFVTTVYLISPFSWYESAIWGQHDQMSVFFMLLSFLLLTTKFKVFSSLMFLISIGLKPTGIIFVPLFVWLVMTNKKLFISVLEGSFLALIFYFLLVKLISPNNFIVFNVNLSRQMFVKGDWNTWVNVFNFWRLVTDFQTDSRNLFLGISYQIWGYIFFGVINIYAYLSYRKFDVWNILKLLFVVSFGGWLFMTSMHERYLFIALISGLLLTIKYKELFKLWLILSVVFWLNLYYAWFEPQSWVLIKNFLTWPNETFIPKILSTTMIVLFFTMTKKLKSSSDLKVKHNYL